ncbi:hypothetical protein [Leptospira sp. GIMC2001]|uniref:hypothetical protein n=1 Tax=Leptospira sp. GIMC2001 TaxID=1513297 RepID=UPI00300DF945
MASKPKRIAFNKLLAAMRRLSVEVNDHEICKRLEVLMLTSKEDLALSSIKILIDKPLDFEPKEVPEPYTQYVRHFIYMVKRNERLGNGPVGYGSDADGLEKKAKPKKEKISSSSVTQEKTKEPTNKPIPSQTSKSATTKKVAKKKKTATKSPSKK